MTKPVQKLQRSDLAAELNQNAGGQQRCNDIRQVEKTCQSRQPAHQQQRIMRESLARVHPRKETEEIAILGSGKWHARVSQNQSVD